MSYYSNEVKQTAAELLEIAADILYTEGHCKGTFAQVDVSDGSLTYCALGSLREARQRHLRSQRAKGIDYVYDPTALRWIDGSMLADRRMLWRARTEHGFTDVPTWNDAPLTTAEAVIESMKQAAKELRNEAAEEGSVSG